MALIYWLLLIALVLGIGWLLTVKLQWNVWPRENLPKGKARLMTIRAWAVTLFLVIAFFGALLSPLYYEFPNQPISTVASYENGQIVYHKYGMFCWEFGNAYFNAARTNHSPGSSTGSVTLITENPKVRKISYTISPFIADREKFYDIPENRKLSVAFGNNRTDDLDKRITFLTEYAEYEFNAKHSKEMAQFYNPKSQAHQDGMRTLILENLGKDLAKQGIGVDFISFEIE